MAAVPDSATVKLACQPEHFACRHQQAKRVTQLEQELQDREAHNCSLQEHVHTAQQHAQAQHTVEETRVIASLELLATQHKQQFRQHAVQVRHQHVCLTIGITYFAAICGGASCRVYAHRCCLAPSEALAIAPFFPHHASRSLISCVCMCRLKSCRHHTKQS